MTQLEKKAKKSFWFFLKPLIGLIPSTSQSLPPHPSLLVLRPDRLGDFILSAPAITALLRKAGPSARVTLVAGVPNELLTRRLFPSARVWVFRKNIFSRMDLLIKILLNRFDAVVDFHSYPFSTTSALMALVSGSSRRVGFINSQGPNELQEAIFNWGVPAPSENTHESQKSMLLSRKLYPAIKFPGLKAVFKMDLVQDQRLIEKFLAQTGIKPDDRLIGFHPTLAKEDNRWNPEYYLELLRLVPPRKGIKWVLFHGRGEGNQLENFKKAVEDQPGVVILPSDHLSQVMAAAGRCSLFVGGDSGLTHACAIMTRVIALFGPSDPRRWGPLSLHRPVIIRSADQKCGSIQPKKVAAVVKKALIKK